ncbi:MULTISPECIES: hypothetical protein [Pseudomonadaceae]|uniref:hypothetical protein n=1 Tax=Pseudomonadaceae TaxID=135621 RepID=UPI0015E39F70|nr:MULTISPECIES: hypothetical protein [Pseudomonadaceae]MBA1280596.1 hypothetical protein [Stutzerimonas stutzeri]MBH8610675.1 hypothetical protein [Pseudomonas mohnii]
MRIEGEQLAEVAEYLRGTCNSVDDAIAALGLSEDIDTNQLEADLLEEEVEICVSCNWWHEVCELQYSEPHGGGLCEQCCGELGVEFD